MKKTEPLHIFFYISSLVVIIIAAFFERKFLIYALPMVIFSIGLLYIKSIDKINVWYLISLLVMLIGDILIYLDFIKYFSIICTLTSIYFLLCALILKKYISPKNFKISTLLSLPIVVSVCLITYLVHSISQLVLHMVLDATPYVIINVFGLLTYVAVSYFIYITDIYKGGLKLLIVACLCIFIVSLLSINELFYYSTVFTVLINITHILGFYIFMKFLTNTKPENNIQEDHTYI